MPSASGLPRVWAVARRRAVRAALGEQGVMEGVDYRDIPVVAFATRIKGTEWSLVSKQDTEDIFADWRFRSRLILAAMVALACMPLVSKKRDKVLVE